MKVTSAALLVGLGLLGLGGAAYQNASSEAAGVVPPGSVGLEWVDLRCSTRSQGRLRPGRQILNGVSGRAVPGRCVVVILVALLCRVEMAPDG
jgi:hypothetical protein